jgi:hypothetical protein
VSMRLLIRLVPAALLGVAAAALVSCGSSGKGLIPLADAGPLQSDFEAVAHAAQTGDGDCTTTAAAINKTEQDFATLPASIDPGLRAKLQEGIKNLREHALALCAQPLAQTTTTSAQRTTTTTPPPKTQTTTPPTTTQTTSTQTTSTTPTTPTTPNNGGGTVAPGESPAGGGVGQGGGTGAGEAEEAGSGEAPGNGQGTANGRGDGGPGNGNGRGNGQ